MKPFILLMAWWFFWFTADGRTWQQYGQRFPSEARCQYFKQAVMQGTGKVNIKEALCLTEHPRGDVP